MEVLPYGVFVEHGFEMQEVYNGKTFPSFVASDVVEFSGEMASRYFYVEPKGFAEIVFKSE